MEWVIQLHIVRHETNIERRIHEIISTIDTKTWAGELLMVICWSTHSLTHGSLKSLELQGLLYQEA